jgi:hypothetical protein
MRPRRLLACHEWGSREALSGAACRSDDSPRAAGFFRLAGLRGVADSEHHAIWAIRLDSTSHQITVDNLRRSRFLPPGPISFGLGPGMTALGSLGLLLQSARKTRHVQSGESGHLAAGTTCHT